MEGFKDWLFTRLSYSKDSMLKYILKPLRKENKLRKWYLLILVGGIYFAYIFYKTQKIIFFILCIILIVFLNELDLVSSGKLMNYKRRKGFGKYYKYNRKERKRKK